MKRKYILKSKKARRGVGSKLGWSEGNRNVNTLRKLQEAENLEIEAEVERFLKSI
jgi:hypothetical protein